ncbi:MAG: tetratricopeptide repeat protein, partial [Desulfobacteraceae bacterium]
ENYEKGARYSKLAGKKAQKAASFKEAIEYANKEALCLERLPTTQATQRGIIDARTRLAGYHLSLTHHVEANEAVAPIANLAAELNYQKRLPLIYTAMGTYKDWVKEDFSEGFRYLSEALKISEEMKDTLSSWYASWFLGMNLSMNCDFEKGFEFFKKSLDLGTSLNRLIMIAMAKIGIVSFNYADRGKNDLAYQTSKEALQMAQESGDTYIKGITCSGHGLACYGKGLLDESEDSLIQALSFCEKAAQLGWWAGASGWLGHVYSDMGDYKKAQAYYEKGISALERTRIYPYWVNMWKISMLRSKVLNNDQDITLDEIFEYYESINVKAAKGWAARHVGEILLNIDDEHLSEAENWVKKAIEVDKRNGTMWSLGLDQAFYAEWFKRKGDQPKAKENLVKAIDILKECGADGWVKKYEEEMASLS